MSLNSGDCEIFIFYSTCLEQRQNAQIQNSNKKILSGNNDALKKRKRNSYWIVPESEPTIVAWFKSTEKWLVVELCEDL